MLGLFTRRVHRESAEREYLDGREKMVEVPECCEPSFFLALEVFLKESISVGLVFVRC